MRTFGVTLPENEPITMMVNADASRAFSVIGTEYLPDFYGVGVWDVNERQWYYYISESPLTTADGVPIMQFADSPLRGAKFNSFTEAAKLAVRLSTYNDEDPVLVVGVYGNKVMGQVMNPLIQLRDGAISHNYMAITDIPTGGNA